MHSEGLSCGGVFSSRKTLRSRIPNAECKFASCENGLATPRLQLDMRTTIKTASTWRARTPTVRAFWQLLLSALFRGILVVAVAYQP